MCRMHEAKGVRLAIEPSLRTDQSFVHTLRDAIDVADAAGIGLVADLGNCWMERDVETTVRRAGPRIAAVQFADAQFGTPEKPLPRGSGRTRETGISTSKDSSRRSSKRLRGAIRTGDGGSGHRGRGSCDAATRRAVGSRYEDAGKGADMSQSHRVQRGRDLGDARLPVPESEARRCCDAGGGHRHLPQ